MGKTIAKLLLVAGLTVALLTLGNEAYAHGANRKAPDKKSHVTCPAGTCGPHGGVHPPSLNKCKPEHCRS